jgi:tetrapyrrole methylase family protein/MazG family protein
MISSAVRVIIVILPREIRPNMKEINDFLKTIEDIRHPDKGCVWNLKQTHSSLKRYLLEELYETLEAIDNDDPEELKEELGDLLLQIVLHSRMAEEKGLFSFKDVVAKIDDKMIKRHPHVFGDDAAKNTEEVDKLWDAKKAQEKEARKSIFEGIPKEMPALARAWKISKKAVKESFEWDEEEKLYAQLLSEIDELKEVVEASRAKSKDPYKDDFASEEMKKDAELELGDVLFTVVNIARWFKIDPEEALRMTNNKFISRFDVMMDLCKAEKKSMKEYSPSELEDKWQEAKDIILTEVNGSKLVS